MRIYSQDIGMEFGREKYAMLVMKSGKQHMTLGVELSNQVVRTLGEKETHRYLGIIIITMIIIIENFHEYIPSSLSFFNNFFFYLDWLGSSILDIKEWSVYIYTFMFNSMNPNLVNLSKPSHTY